MNIKKIVSLSSLLLVTISLSASETFYQKKLKEINEKFDEANSARYKPYLTLMGMSEGINLIKAKDNFFLWRDISRAFDCHTRNKHYRCPIISENFNAAKNYLQDATNLFENTAKYNDEYLPAYKEFWYQQLMIIGLENEILGKNSEVAIVKKIHHECEHVPACSSYKERAAQHEAVNRAILDCAALKKEAEAKNKNNQQ